MNFAVIPSLYPYRSTALEKNDMTATYTFDIFSTLDGYGSYTANADWGGSGASKARNSSTTALPCTAQSSG